MERTIVQVVEEFFRDARLYLLFGLVFVDLAFGVAAAFKTGVFDPARVADFYRTKVVPGVLGFLALYIAAELVPESVALLGDGVQWVAAGLVYASLAASILENFKLVYGILPSEHRG